MSNNETAVMNIYKATLLRIKKRNILAYYNTPTKIEFTLVNKVNTAYAQLLRPINVYYKSQTM